MPNQKTIIPGKIDKNSKKEFKVNKHHPGEKDIFILFDNDVEFSLDKLSLDGLPGTLDGKRAITWLNNFVLRTANGLNADGVTYSVLIEAGDGDTIVYYDDKGLHTYDQPKTRSFNNKNWKEIRLNRGDPAIGIAT